MSENISSANQEIFTHQQDYSAINNKGQRQWARFCGNFERNMQRGNCINFRVIFMVFNRKSDKLHQTFPNRSLALLDLPQNQISTGIMEIWIRKQAFFQIIFLQFNV